MGYGDDNGIIGIEVLGVELVVEGNDLRLALVAILLLHLQEVLLHHLLAALRIIQDFLQIGDELHQVVILLMQLVDTQARQLAQSHVDDGLRLQFVEIESFLEVALGVSRCLALADDVDHLVDIIHGNDESFKNVSSFLSLFQVVLRTADGHLMAMIDEIADTFAQAQQAWTKPCPVASLDGHKSDVVH